MRGANVTEKYGSALGSICPDHGRRRATRVRRRLLRKSWNLESLQGVVDAAEATASPVIVGFSGANLPDPRRALDERLGLYAALGKAACATTHVSGLPAVQRIALILLGPTGGRTGVQRGDVRGRTPAGG